MIVLWKTILILTLIHIKLIRGKLSGDHVCVTEKTFLVNATEYYIRNVTVRHYEWCLNYPPRCSYYTTNKVNTTRIVEKNETYLVEECCPNFVEKEDKCISLCTNCKNGICENGSCSCLTGFKGEDCNLECSFNEWGPNCSKPCDCNNNGCDSMTGLCHKEIRIAVTTAATRVTVAENTSPQDSPNSHMITEWLKKISANEGQPVPKNKDENTTATSIKQVFENGTDTSLYDFTGSPEITNDSLKNIDLNGSIASKFPFTTTETLMHTNITNQSLSVKLNEKYSTNHNISITNTKKLPNTTKDLNKQIDLIPEKTFSTDIFPIKTFSNGTIATKVGLLIPVEIQYDKLQKVLSNETRLLSNEEYLNRHIYENDYPSRDLVLFTIAILVAFLGVLAVLIINIMKKRKLNQNVQQDNNQVAVFQASIFDSPLPAIREYEYDHPTSTRSYNAPSVLNPVEVENHKILEQISEPIYDEIPHKVFEPSSNDSHSAIYVNTIGRTEL